MKKFAVIGNPIQHSLSPLLHNSIFEQLGINASYEKVKLLPADLESFVTRNEFDGYNITIPHKNSISSYLDHITNDAHNITAVNCVHNNKGYNTDWMGFIHALNQNQIEVKDKSCLIIGSGGAAYAIAYALIECEVSSISIKNRNRKNKIKLEEWVNNRFIQKTDLDPEIIINCTPLGMHPLEQKIPSNLKVNKTNIVIDTIYNPLKTKWLKHCEENGAKIINGLEMLIYQGIASLNIWLKEDFFKELDIKTIKNRLEKEIC